MPKDFRIYFGILIAATFTMPYPACKAAPYRNNSIQPARRTEGRFFVKMQPGYRILILFLLLVQYSAAQPAPDTSQAFLNRIQSIVDKNGKALLEQINSNKETYYQVFNPCIKNEQGKKGFAETRANYHGLLQDRVQSEIKKIYQKPSTAAELFGKRNEEYVSGFAAQWIKNGKVNQKLINKLAELCAAAQPQKNSPPVAVVISPVNVMLPDNNATLDGSKSFDSDNEQLKYFWQRISGPTATDDVLLSKDLPVATASNLAEGTYMYVLGVQDKSGASDYDTVIVNVGRRRLPPDADAGTDTIITLPDDKVLLHGKATDPNEGGRIVFVQWKKTEGPSRFRIVSENKEETPVENLEAGTYTFQLIVINNAELRDTDYVSVKVNPEIPKIPPVSNAGLDQVINEGDAFTLSGSGSDSDGFITGYRWVKLEGPGNLELASETDSVTQVSGLHPGRYIFELTVTDNDDLVATDTMILQVQAHAAVPLWIWVLILIITAGAAGTTWYIIWWRNKKEKLIVYFLNREEEELAQQFMHGYKKTEGYVLGHSTRGRIQKMKKKGLALKVLNTTRLLVQTPGVTRVYKYSPVKGEMKLTSETRERPGYDYVNILPQHQEPPPAHYIFPGFYIITLDAPLLPVFEEQLRAISVDVIQRIPSNSYIVYIKEEWQLEKLQHQEEFRFIRLARPYTAEDTGFTVRKEAYLRSLLPSSAAPLALDLVLHRKEDAAAVETFLAEHKVEITGMKGNTIRIKLYPGTLSPEKITASEYIQAVYEHIPPVLYNNIAREMIGIEESGTRVLNFSETGDGEIIAVADTGIDQSHPDLSAAVTEAVSWGRTAANDTSDPHGHGTHVTGTIAGNGTASGGAIAGMAPGVKIFFQSLLAEDNGTLCDLGMNISALLQQAYDKNARIINISWGASTESYYTFDSAMIDEFVYDHQDMLVVISAGNEGAAKKDNSGKPLPGFGTVGSPATTKNGLTVGASFSKRMQDDPESIAAFSSKGPCRNDHRIKPDITAPGTNILSAKSSMAPLSQFESFDKNTAYVYLSGTSMATPVVSGAAAMIREFYRKKKNCPRPSAALIKATLLNGTKRLTGSNAMQASTIIPNNNQGYGMLQLLTTIPKDENAFALWFCDSFNEPSLVFRQTGERRMFRLQLNKKTWLRVCMVFADNPRIAVQSDIDLIVNHQQTGNKLTGNAGINAGNSYFAATVEDFTNNIEIVREENAEPGEYIIEAVATHMAPEGQTAFAMVITTGDTGSSFSSREL